MDQLATRLWFVLRYFGYENVRVLNGGWSAYQKARLPIEEGTSKRRLFHYDYELTPKAVNSKLVKDAAQVIIEHENHTSTFVDCRRAAEYKSLMKSTTNILYLM